MPSRRLYFELSDIENIKSEPISGEVFITEHGIEVFFDIPNFCDSQDGSPIYIEIRNGIPYVVIWADKNSQDPTHTISLQNAKG